MRILITGASGFIGSHLAEKALTSGHSVRLFLRETSSRTYLKHPDYEVSIGSLEDLASLESAISGIDLIFHLAGTVAAKSEESYFKINSEGTKSLALAARQSSHKPKIIYVSSLAAGGPSDQLGHPRNEIDEDCPVSFYGKSKLAGEESLFSFKELSSIAIRPPIVYGPREKELLSVFKLVNRGLCPVISPTSQPQKTYSFIYVEDLVQILLALAENFPTSNNKVFYVGEKTPHTWMSFISKIENTLGKKSFKPTLPFFIVKLMAWSQKILPAKWVDTQTFNQDKLHEIKADAWTLDPSLIRNDLDLTAETSLEEGVQKTIEWYKSEGLL